MRIKLPLPPLVVTALLASLLLPLPVRTQQGVSGAAQTPHAGVGRFYALVIGNDDYASLPKLKTATADAREVERVLRESYGFRTRLLVNATRAQIVSALSAYRRELGADANLVVYYAGHGYNDKEAGKAYWLPVDASRDDASNWIIADEITTGIRVIPARKVLVISDSCYSGTLTRGLSLSTPPPSEREQFLQRMAAGRSRTLMASGGDEPVADGGGSGHSVFASALLRGLRQMDKPQFTAAELFSNYVIEPVAGRAEQTPVYDPLRNSGHESGDFVFVRVKVDGKTVEVTVNTPPLPRVDPAQQELAFWTTIQNSTDPEDFKDYLARYPDGLYAGLARRRVASLTGAPPAGNTARPAATPTVGEESNAASSNSPSAYLFQDDFLNNQNGWPEGHDLGALIITDGKYVVENKMQNINFTTWLVHKQIQIGQQQDFSIEAQMTFLGGDEGNFYGFVWGLQDPKIFHYFGITANGNYAYRKMVNGEWVDPISYRPTQHIKQRNATNKIGVRKRGAALELYINDAYVNSASFEPFAGSIGFHLNHYMKVEIEYIRVKAEPPTAGEPKNERADPPASVTAPVNRPAANTSPAPRPPARPTPGTVFRARSGIELVYIPPGEFLMGSETGTDDEKPVHRVTFREGFWMGKYEVTHAQWQAAMGNKRSAFEGCDACPVVVVSWNDAQSFIRKLNEQDDGFTYRLPSEAEWEYACRAGATGDAVTSPDSAAWYAANAGYRPHPVGEKQANGFGLYDMQGNAWEWVQDQHHSGYVGAPADGSAWLTGGAQEHRVKRGGSWSFGAGVLRCAFRGRDSSNRPDSDIGFRVVAVARR